MVSQPSVADLLTREIKDETLASALISIVEVETSPDLRQKFIISL